jgi:hypothetical protein
VPKLVDSKTWRETKDAERASLGIAKSNAEGPGRLEDADYKLLPHLRDLEQQERTIPWTISDEGRDRDGDRIMQNGWDLSHYKANPVVQPCHDYKQWPIGRSLECWVSQSTGKGPRLRALKQFCSQEENPAGAMAYRLAKAGYLKTASVGFLPLAYEPDEEQDDDGDENTKVSPRIGHKFTRTQLLESSIVPVPSNPRALAEARSVHGIDVSPMIELCERVLDEVKGSGLWVPRKTWEEARKVAGEGVLLQTAFSFAPTPSTYARPTADFEWSVRASPLKAATNYTRLGNDDPGAPFDAAAEMAKAEPHEWYWMCAVWDPSQPENASAYKLIHHIADGLKANWIGVRAAMVAALSGAGIEEGERLYAYQHLRNHFNEFSQDAPEFRLYAEAEIKALIPEKLPAPVTPAEKTPTTNAAPYGAATTNVTNAAECVGALQSCADYILSGAQLTAEEVLRIDNASDLVEGAIDMVGAAMGVPDPDEDDGEDMSTSRSADTVILTLIDDEAGDPGATMFEFDLEQFKGALAQGDEP